MKLIVGIGNFEKKYNNTRHNIGFKVIDGYTKENTWIKQHNSDVFISGIGDSKVIFIKPLTYVNNSGIEVKYFADYYKIAISDILVIRDDISLPFGTIRIKVDSASGGHNGIKSIITNLNSKEFIQLKIGISLDTTMDVKDYVLGKFTKDEKKDIVKILTITEKIIGDFINNKSIDSLMNQYN